MKKEFDILIDVRNEEAPLPMIKVDIVTQILEAGDILKVVLNSQSNYENIKKMISKKNAFSMVDQKVSHKDFILYITKC